MMKCPFKGGLRAAYESISSPSVSNMIEDTLSYSDMYGW